MPVLDLNDTAAVKKYESFVQSSPYGQVNQDLGWAQVKNNWEPRYAYVTDETGQIIAAISMLLTQTKLGKKFAYAAKGPIMDIANLDLLDQLMVEAKKALDGDDAYVLRMDPEVAYSEELDDALQARGFQTRNRNVADEGMHATIQPRLNMVLDLTTKPDAKETFDLYPSKTKSKLKRPMRDGVTVRYGSDAASLDAFYETYVNMANRHGITYRPKDYFERMLTTFGGENGIMRVYMAEREGELLSTGIGFKYGRKIWYMYAGSNDGPTYYAPYAVQTAMIQWALDAGVDLYDMGGIASQSTDDGLYVFKHTFIKADPREYIGEIDLVLDENAYTTLVHK